MRVLKCCMAIGVVFLCAQAAAAAQRKPSSPYKEMTAPIERIGKCSGFLEGVLVDGKGGLWMLDVEGGRILHAAPGEHCKEKARLDGFPAGAKFAPNGTITIVGRGGIHSFDPNTNVITRISALYEGQELTGLNDLSYDDRGGFYFTAPGDSDAFHPTGRVFYRSSEGEITLIASGIAYANGIAVTPDGNNVAIAEFGTNRILSVPAVHSTHRLKFPYILGRIDGGYGPDGMAYAPDGRLLIANFGAGAIEILEPRYGFETFYLPSGGGTWTTNLTVHNNNTIVIVEAEKGEIWHMPLPPTQASRRHEAEPGN